MFLSIGFQIKKGKPFETPSLVKIVLLTFVNRRSSVQSGSPAPFFQLLSVTPPFHQEQAEGIAKENIAYPQVLTNDQRISHNSLSYPRTTKPPITAHRLGSHRFLLG